MRVAPLLVLAVLASTSAAAADEANCPAGSSSKTESGLTWCEPSVCETDTNCKTGEVCRPVALCVEIGTMAGDAGKRLMVRQRCGADKSCPSTTTCSDMKRCVSKAEADKMAPAPAASAPAAPAKKGMCSVGVPDTSLAPLGLALGLALVARRRRATAKPSR